jgi:hypothetical protein
MGVFEDSRYSESKMGLDTAFWPTTHMPHAYSMHASYDNGFPVAFWAFFPATAWICIQIRFLVSRGEDGYLKLRASKHGWHETVIPL